MNEKTNLSWIANIQSGKNNTSIFPPISFKSSKNLIPNYDKLAIDSKTDHIRKPFMVTARSLLNREVFLIDRAKKNRNKFYSVHSKPENQLSHKIDVKNYVKAHSLGFSTQLNEDFFKHYYRMLLVNFFYIMKRKKNYSPLSLQVETSEYLKKPLNFIPLDIKLFFLDKAKKDMIFFEKLIEIHKESNMKTQYFHSSNKKTKKTTSKNQVFIDFPPNFANKNINEKLFKEDQFLQVFVKKIRKFGLEIMNQSDYELLKTIVIDRKKLISLISYDLTQAEKLTKIISVKEKDKIPKILKGKENFHTIMQQLTQKIGFTYDKTDNLEMKNSLISSNSKLSLDKNPNINPRRQSILSLFVDGDHNQRRSDQKSAALADNIIFSTDFIRKMTKNEISLSKINEIDPEIALKMKHKLGKNSGRSPVFSKNTKSFLKELLDRHEKKYEVILKKIQGKTKTVSFKEKSEVSKKLKLKSLPFNENLNILKNDFEGKKIEILMNEIENFEKITIEEIMSKDLDGFVEKASFLEKKIRENVVDIEKNYIITKNNEKLNEDIDNLQKEINQQKIDDILKKEIEKKNNYLNNAENNLKNENNEIILNDINRDIMNNNDNKKNNHIIRNSTVIINNNTSQILNNFNLSQNSIENYSIPSSQLKQPEIEIIKTNHHSPFIKLKSGSYSNITNASLKITNKLKEKKEFEKLRIIKRDKSQILFPQKQVSLPKFPSRYSFDSIKSPISPKKPPIPSFKLVGLTPLKKSSKKKQNNLTIKIYRNQLKKNRVKTLTSIPSISPLKSLSIREFFSPMSQRLPKRNKKPKKINDFFKIKAEKNNGNNSSMNLNSQFMKSEKKLKYLSKQNTYKNFQQKSNFQNSNVELFVFDNELKDATLGLEDKKKESQKSGQELNYDDKNHNKKKNNKKKTKNIDRLNSNQESDFSFSEKEIYSLSDIENKKHKENFNGIDRDIDIKRELLIQKREEIDMFVKNLQETLEKKLIGEVPCIDKLRFFMDQTEKKLKSYEYPWHKVFLKNIILIFLYEYFLI